MISGGETMNEKGFTLIEVMVSMTLVGILAVAFIPILSAQYVNIYKTGDKSKVTYDAIEKLEDEIAKPESKVENAGDTVTNEKIIFGDKEIETRIKEVEVEAGEDDKNNKQKTTLKVGVPVDTVDKSGEGDEIKKE